MRTVIPRIVVLLLISVTTSFAQSPAAPCIPDVRLAALQYEKAELEVKELRLKSALGPLNQPIVSTALTLLVGGFLFSILSDRRARRNARLEKAIEFVDEVAADLNATLTPLFRYIRIRNREGTQPEPPIDKTAILTSVEDKLPKLFEKRLSVSIKVKAFLPRKSQRFASKYVRLCQELDRVSDILLELKESKTPEIYVERINKRKQSFRNEWEAPDAPTGRKLKQPFKELDDWIEMVWLRSTQLMASTLRELVK